MEKGISSVNKLFVKYKGNPILSPNRYSEWECFQVFNAGALYLDDRIHLVYRAIGLDGISRFGYAYSHDGFRVNFRSPSPIYERKTLALSHFKSPSGGGSGGCEDPRLVKIGDENIYMTYTAYGEDHLAVGMTYIKVKDFLAGNWRWNEEEIISPPNEIHKNFVLFPEKINGKYAILHSITPRISISYVDNLKSLREKQVNSKYKNNTKLATWERAIKGAGPPPIKTREGWLLFHHGIDKKEDWKYKIGVMLLDLKNPEVILYKSREPVIEPTESYEYMGFKPGVTYTCGAILKGDLLILYYGAADTYVCAAYTWIDEFLDRLTNDFEKHI